MPYRIEKIVPGGYGLTRDEAGIILVPSAAPGEQVILTDIQSRGSVRYATIESITEPSPERTTPRCPLYGECGGCDFQHLSYEAQLEAKRDILIDALIRQGGFDADDPLLKNLECEPAQAWGGRNRFRFPIVEGQPSLYRRMSRMTVPVPNCPVADPAINAFLQASAQGAVDLQPFAAASLKDRDKEPNKGPDKGPDKRNARNNSRRNKNHRGRQSRAGAGAGERLPEVPVFAVDGDLTWGSGEHSIVLQGKQLVFDVRGFFQSSISGFTRVLDWVLPRARECAERFGGNALDLYCGAGVFGSMLPETITTVFACDINSGSIAYARRNIGKRGIYDAMDAGQWTEKYRSEYQPEHGPLGLAIVDPPRQGLDRKLVELLLELKVPALIYVSCDPVTFARDLKLLSYSFLQSEKNADPPQSEKSSAFSRSEKNTYGYEVHDIQAFDLSPQTHNGESAALLIHRSMET